MENLSAAQLCFRIFEEELHLPLIGKKVNREKIEDAITVKMMRGELGCVTQENVDLALELVDDLLALYRISG